MIKIPNLFHKYENSIRTFTLALLLLLVVSGCTDQAVEGRPAKIVEADLTATTSSSDNATSQPATPAATKTPISTQVVSTTSSTAIPATAANTATTTTTPTSVPTATTVVPTTTPTPVPVPTPTEILTPVPTPIEILTPVPTPTATPTQVPTPTATPTPTETPTPTVTSTPTTVPSPTPTIIVATNPTPTITPPTPTPAPTSTPVPIPDDRYGVIASGPGLAWQLETLGTDWFIDYKADPRGAPAGTNRVPYIGVKPGTVRIAPELLAEYAAGVPGSYWYIGGETNVPAQNGIEPASYVVEFDYYRQLILAADPTAKFLGPSVLNWDFTCTGCGGYMTGHVWMSDFVDAYAAAHSGESPPIDAWAIDAYPLTWSATPEYPNPLPMVEWQIVADQAIGLRDFLKTVPGHADTPIWITEVASHWAYDEVGWVNSNLAIPETPYRWDLMSEYIVNLVTWLQSNGPTLKIDRWFLYRGYINIADHAKSGYAGIYLFESGDTGAALTPAGEVYRDFASGIRP